MCSLPCPVEESDERPDVVGAEHLHLLCLAHGAVLQQLPPNIKSIYSGADADDPIPALPRRKANLTGEGDQGDP